MQHSRHWQLFGPGIFRSNHLDPSGRRYLIGVGDDYRELVRVPVIQLSDARALTRELRAWLEDPTLPMPVGAVLHPEFHPGGPRRRWAS